MKEGEREKGKGVRRGIGREFSGSYQIIRSKEVDITILKIIRTILHFYLIDLYAPNNKLLEFVSSFVHVCITSIVSRQSPNPSSKLISLTFMFTTALGMYLKGTQHDAIASFHGLVLRSYSVKSAAASTFFVNQISFGIIKIKCSLYTIL